MVLSKYDLLNGKISFYHVCRHYVNLSFKVHSVGLCVFKAVFNRHLLGLIQSSLKSNGLWIRSFVHIS